MGISKQSVKTGFNRIGVIAGIITGVIGVFIYALVIGQSIDGWSFFRLIMIAVAFIVSFLVGWLVIYFIGWIVSGFFD